MALGQYRQSKSEHHRRRSAREDFRDVFITCGDEKVTPKIHRKFSHLPILAREEPLRRVRTRHPDLTGGADLTWAGLSASSQTCPDEIIRKLRQMDVLAAQVRSIADAVRAIGTTGVTYYHWRKEFGGNKMDQVRKLKQLEAENARLRRAVYDPTLDTMILADDQHRDAFNRFDAIIDSYMTPPKGAA